MASMEPNTAIRDAKPQGQETSGNPLSRDALNLPNLITLSRFLLAIVLFTLIYIHGFWVTSAVLFIVAAWTDFLDGYIARKYGMVTVLGRILDPFVDKIIIGGAFIFLSEKTVIVDGGTLHSGVNAWMAIIVIGREMFITSLRGFLEQQGQDFSASWSGKIKMVLQCVAVPASLLSLDPRFATEGFLLTRDILLWTAVAVTVYSGAIYVIRAVNILSSPKPPGD
jgi:CDP-diacylglycerol---glycerol-3-phosphate 3-phosphatidyltransferase